MDVLNSSEVTNCPRCGSDNYQDIPKSKDIVGTIIATIVFSFCFYLFGFHFPMLWYLLIAMPVVALFLIFKPTRKRLCLDCKKVWEYRVPTSPKP